MCSHVAVDPSGFVALTGGRGGKTLEARPVRKDADHARASPHRHVVVRDTVGGRHLFARLIDPHRIDNPDGGRPELVDGLGCGHAQAMGDVRHRAGFGVRGVWHDSQAAIVRDGAHCSMYIRPMRTRNARCDCYFRHRTDGVNRCAIQRRKPNRCGRGTHATLQLTGDTPYRKNMRFQF